MANVLIPERGDQAARVRVDRPDGSQRTVFVDPHTGRVTVCAKPRVGPSRVWTNTPTCGGAPEACLYLDTDVDGTTVYSLCGSCAWVLAETRESPTGVRKVLDAILAEGWQVQGLDAEGVGVARVTTWGTR